MEKKMDSHKMKTTPEAENSIKLSMKKNKKWQPAAKLISGYDVAEPKVSTNLSPLRSEFFSPSPSCVDSKGQKINIYIKFLDLQRINKHCGSVDTKDRLWIKCKFCEKQIICRTSHPFNVFLCKEQNSESTEHLTNLNL